MTQIKLRRDTSAAFASSNPILGNGEPAYETDTKKLKIGDGTTAYTQLEYFSATGGGSSESPANMVTTDTTQDITGNKTFTGLNTIQGDTYITKYLILDTENSQTPAIAISDGASLTRIITPTNNGITLGNFLRTVTFEGDVKLSDGNFVLGQGSITAGDNITLERTEKGVKISSTGGGSSESPANMVTTDTTQDITGNKSFTTGKTTFKNTDSNRKILGEINGNGFYCNYFTDKASGEKPCYLGKISQTAFNLGIPDSTGTEGRIYATTLEKWQNARYVGTFLDSSNLGSYVDGTTITYANNKLSAASSGGGLEVKRATTANFNSSELLETGLYFISGGLSPQNGPTPYAVAAMLITMKSYVASNNQYIQQTWIGCEDLVANQIYTRYSRSNGVMTSWVRVDSNKIASASALGSIKVGNGLTISSDGTLSASGGSNLRYPVEVSDKSLMPSWYVVYNDGWCEQGGKSVITATTTHVTLLKPFASTDYSIIGSISGSNETLNIPSAASTKLIDSFEFHVANIGGEAYWKVCGYIA